MRPINPYSLLNPTFDIHDIHIIHLPNTGTIHPKVTLSMATTDLPAEEKQAIESAWDKVTEKEPLSNEDIVSVRFMDLTTGEVKGALSDYKTWKTTAQQSFYQRFGALYIPNALNVQLLAQTADNFLIFGTRPPKSADKLPALQVPGGMLTRHDMINNHISPKTAACREFHEEVGNIPLINVSYLGATFYPGRVLTTLYYTAQVSFTAHDLNTWRIENKEHIKDFDAFPETHFVPVTPAGIKQVLASNRLRETAQAGLLLKGRQVLGDKWFQNTKARTKVR